MLDAINRLASKDHKIFGYVESCEVFHLRLSETARLIIPDRVNDLQKKSSPVNVDLYDIRTF
jgi:hypothetical protein